MAREQPLFNIGQFAFDYDASDLTNQYTFVDLDNAAHGATGTGMGNAALKQAAAGSLALGIAQQNGVVNESCNVMVLGQSFCKVSASAASGKVGDLLAVGDNGCAIKAASGAYAVARACEDYNAGEITTVLLMPFGKQ
jgi:hypothetical protein